MCDSVLADKERHERKRMAAILYQKYKNRQSVINPGSKEIPKGKPNCLADLSFLVTGVLESMERDEVHQVIKDYGGKIAKSIIKGLDYMVVGEEAGRKKIATAEELGIKMISEDGLFDLIRDKSGITLKSNEEINSKENKQNKEEVEQKRMKKDIKGAFNSGLKIIPKGRPNCLSLLNFLVTGVLKSMDRNEVNQVIKDFGGKISKSIINELDYVVVGEEPGLKKIITAEKLGIKMISEDELFDLIKQKSEESLENNLNLE